MATPIMISSGPRWTIGRLATDVSIIPIAVPVGLKLLSPEARLPGRICGDTPENNSLILGLMILIAANAGPFLKALNDSGERAIDRLTRSRHPDARPKPLDDS